VNRDFAADSARGAGDDCDSVLKRKWLGLSLGSGGHFCVPMPYVSTTMLFYCALQRAEFVFALYTRITKCLESFTTI